MSARTRSRVKGTNRLAAVKSAEDSGAVTIQTSEFDALGRRIKKVVTNAGDYDKTEVYYHDGQRICQINNGSGTMVQQFIAPLTRRCRHSSRAARRHRHFPSNGESRANGTQYIDEVVMMRVADKGDLYVHQDANWNVIGTTDLGRHVVERNVYTPYGELTVHQDTGYGDRDGDQDVDSTDKGTVGTTCTGTVSGSCRILDLDFDGDYDSTDATKFDALTQGAQRHPGRASTATSQPFAHQGLLFEPELAQYQNRARQYHPEKRGFGRPDPRGIRDLHLNNYEYVACNPVGLRDPEGLEALPKDAIGTPCSIGTGYDICLVLLQRDANGNNWYDRSDVATKGISFCCYTINSQYGNQIWCDKKSCFATPTPHPCVVQHEEFRKTQYSCRMVPEANETNQCTDLKCKPVYTGTAPSRDCEAYKRLFQCYGQHGIGVNGAACYIQELCINGRTIEEIELGNLCR